MAPLSYTPPGRTLEPRSEPVRRRHVLYVPGYDPESDTRARMLFVRELIRYAKRFGLRERAISKPAAVANPDRLRWTVRTGTEHWTTDSMFEVLRWEDIVRRDFARPVPSRIALLLVGFLHSLVTGVMVRFFRLNWKFGGVILYPFVMICLLMLVAVGVGVAGAALAGWAAGMPMWGRTLIGLALAGGVLAAATPLFERWFVWHLLHDWVFNWQHGNGWRQDYEERVDRFAAHLVEVARNADADEILVVGHSSGSVMAAEVVARALEAEPRLGACGPSVALLTVGSCLPLVALNPSATRCRDGLVRLARSGDVLWVEYQAPQDWLNFAGFNPVRDLGLGIPERDCANPVIRSARFRDAMTEVNYRAILYRPFRMHFQFLMSNDKPAEYDYLMLLLGPLPLSERVREPEAAFTRVFPGRSLPDAEAATADMPDEAKGYEAALQRVIKRPNLASGEPG